MGYSLGIGSISVILDPLFGLLWYWVDLWGGSFFGQGSGKKLVHLKWVCEMAKCQVVVNWNQGDFLGHFSATDPRRPVMQWELWHQQALTQTAPPIPRATALEAFAVCWRSNTAVSGNPNALKSSTFLLAKGIPMRTSVFSSGCFSNLFCRLHINIFIHSFPKETCVCVCGTICRKTDRWRNGTFASDILRCHLGCIHPPFTCYCSGEKALCRSGF